MRDVGHVPVPERVIQSERMVRGRNLRGRRMPQIDQEAGGLDRDRRVDDEGDQREREQQGGGGDDADEDEPAHQLRASASNASRSPSPSWLNVKTVMKIISDGRIVSHTCVRSDAVAGVSCGLRTVPHTLDSRFPS